MTENTEIPVVAEPTQESAAQLSKPWLMRLVEWYFPCQFFCGLLLSLPFWTNYFHDGMSLWYAMSLYSGVQWIAVWRGRLELAVGLNFIWWLFAGIEPLGEWILLSPSVGMPLSMMAYGAGTFSLAILPVVMITRACARRWRKSGLVKKPLGPGCFWALLLGAFGVLVLFCPCLCMPSRMNLERHMLMRFRVEMLEHADVHPEVGTNVMEYALRVCTKTVFPEAFAVAVNLPTNAPSSFPVLIYNNFDLSEVPRTWKGRADPLAGKRIQPRIAPRLYHVTGIAWMGCEDRYARLADDERVLFWRPGVPLVKVLPEEPYELPKDFYFLTDKGKVYPKD